MLARLSPLFDSMYSKRGRPSIPPEHLLKASLLIALLLGAQRRPQLLPAELHEVFDATRFARMLGSLAGA